MSSKRSQMHETQRRLAEMAARKHQFRAARDTRRLPGHGARSQKGR